MDDPAEAEAHNAALGLLDFAQMAVRPATDSRSRRTLELARTALPRSDTTTNNGAACVAAPRLAVATVTSTGQGRLITSGSKPPTSGQEAKPILQRELHRKGSLRPPATQREAKERVTVIVQKPQQEGKAGKKKELGADVAVPSCDVPVPASAFAPHIGSGDSGKSSAEFTPFAANICMKEETGSDSETESDDVREGKVGAGNRPANATPRPLKKQKMSRAISINTILQRVGSKEEPLADAVGSAPQTVQEMIPHGTGAKVAAKKVDSSVDTLAIVEKLWGAGVAQPKAPSLPQHKSSEHSNVDTQHHLPQSDVSIAAGIDSGPQPRPSGIKRELSMERALHLPPKLTAPTATIKGLVVETGAVPAATSSTSVLAKVCQLLKLISEAQLGLRAVVVSDVMGSNPGSAWIFNPIQEAAEDTLKCALWKGRIKHHLKTVEGVSVVELFSLTTLVPEKLLEQMPPTLFVSALAGRANVKLGKHYVAQCRLENLSDRQRQKMLTLVGMKLVAICELQHCTLTLVPFIDNHQELRIVGFMIADE